MRREGRYPSSFTAISFVMGPMLCAFSHTVIILFILNEIFNSNDMLMASGIMFSSEDPDKPQAHPGPNRPFVFKLHI